MIRRIRWLGYILRLPKETPVRLSLYEALQQTKRPKGRPTTTWTQVANNELKELDYDLKLINDKSIHLTSDRKKWDSLIKCMTEAPYVDDDDPPDCFLVKA